MKHHQNSNDLLTEFLIDIIKQGVQCSRCGYKWVPKNKNKIPRNCANPKCNSPYWNKARQKD
jgi:DNA-directed RNA polymerase subunit RPC12/RpoP